MSGAAPKNETPIENKDILVEYMESGCKPPEQWRIGTEHEKFAFRLSDLKPLSSLLPNENRNTLPRSF